MRGEHICRCRVAASVTGSSPHARGTRVHGPAPRLDVRFIPACAGNTSSSSSWCLAMTVHPRMRGEHQCLQSSDDPDSGSSPHARGTPKQHALNTLDYRFIPACAGNTRHRASTCRTSSVHPRMRGEHRIGSERVVPVVGSSPHARGTRVGLGYRHVLPPVHPRMRGEHSLCDGPMQPCAGSSPHARGTPQPPLATFGVERFIPACAGNTVDVTELEEGKPVHPRMRGEHSKNDLSS